MVEKNIRNIFVEYPEVIYGFTNIAYSVYASAYQSALVFAVPYGEQLTIETYSEEKLEKGIQAAKKVVEKILAQLQKMLAVFVWLPARLEYNKNFKFVR